MAEMKSPNVHTKKNRNDTPRKRKTHIIKVIQFLDKNSQFLSEKLHGIKSAVRRICCAQHNGAIARLHLYQSDRRRKAADRIRLPCKELHLTQSELVRRVLYGVNVK